MESINKKNSSSSWLACCIRGGGIPSSAIASSNLASQSNSPENAYLDDEEKQHVPESSEMMINAERKHGGWKAMPFVLGNETFERLASIGLQANFSMFMMTEFHQNQVSASNVLNAWNGFTNFLPLFGAYVADAYLGRFLTIVLGSIATISGMALLTLIAWIGSLHPPRCDFLKHPELCKSPTTYQKGVLYLAFAFISMGAAGIRPCTIAFGADQFDQTTEKGRKRLNSYFNWYYTTFTIVLILAMTVVVYIQTNYSWVLGFGIPCILMLCGIVLFFLGTRLYVYVQPQGSIFPDIAHALFAAFKKRNLQLPHHGHGGGIHGIFYDPPPPPSVIRIQKLPLTNQFRFLNKAAMILEGELNGDGICVAKWRLSSIQRIEEIKCLLRIFPIWASGIICFTALAQASTFTISQALKMDLHLGPNFKIPPGTLPVISFITVGIFLPIYDSLIVPFFSKRSKIEGGITLLQRIGIGLVFSILSMVVAGVIEKKRRRNHGIAQIQMSAFWLAPQLILMGLCEAFNLLGQIEFYNKEFPESMKSIANSLFPVTMAGANYLSIVIVNVVHKTTGRNGHPDWLTADINSGRLENFYYLLAGFGLLNLLLFLGIAPRYKYKSRVRVDDQHHQSHIQINGHK